MYIARDSLNSRVISEGWEGYNENGTTTVNWQLREFIAEEESILEFARSYTSRLSH